MKEKFYINYEHEGNIKELFEILLYNNQVIIRSSLPQLRKLHLSSHNKPDENNKDACWHVKADRGGVIMEIRRDIISKQFIDLGLVVFKNHLIKECKDFKRVSFNDEIAVKNEQSFKNVTIYFFQYQKTGFSEILNSILEKNFPSNTVPDTTIPGCIDAFYFESSNEITIGCIIISYEGAEILGLNLTGFVKNTIPIVTFLRISRNGDVKKEVGISKSFRNAIAISSDNPWPAGGIILD